MPEEALNQSQTINDLILDILADEAQIIRCLRVFFCDTLQEIADEKCISAERKVKLAQDLINAAAKKEEALAAVLEAISLFEVESVSWIPLAPGAFYPLPKEPPEIIGITFEAKTDPGTSSIIELYAYGEPFKSAAVTETTATIPWNPLGGGPYLVEDLSLTNTGSNTIYIRNLTTE